MRIAELSRVSGVSAPSIKYYLRSGLLHPGERTAPNQANYDDSHVRRLRLIRALIDVGGLSIAAVGEVLASIESQGSNLHKALGTAMAATFPTPDTDDAEPHLAAARQKVRALIERRGWQVDEESNTTDTLVNAIATMTRVSRRDIDVLIESYADMLEKVARDEVAWAVEVEDVEAVVESAVVGTVIGGAVLAGMRRMCHENASARLLAPGGPERG